MSHKFNVHGVEIRLNDDESEATVHDERGRQLHQTKTTKEQTAQVAATIWAKARKIKAESEERKATDEDNPEAKPRSNKRAK